MSVKELDRMFKEAFTYIDKGDAVQASEKLYKVAEESVKMLAKLHNLAEYREAEERGRWVTRLLFKAVDRLSEIYGLDFSKAWSSAWTLHVEGFHEGRLPAEVVRSYASVIEDILNILKRETAHSSMFKKYGYYKP
ncbi:PaREP1 family protein [Candidatus Bathyarchaeota archaeon]|nr:PaREP1 family protein [Candidatus Bathyarchaeota archaeon]